VYQLYTSHTSPGIGAWWRIWYQWYRWSTVLYDLCIR